jgi:hypothetical protein
MGGFVFLDKIQVELLKVEERDKVSSVHATNALKDNTKRVGNIGDTNNNNEVTTGPGDAPPP